MFSEARNKGNPKLMGAMESNPKIFDCEPNSTSFNGNYPLLSSEICEHFRYDFERLLHTQYMGAVEEEHCSAYIFE